MSEKEKMQAGLPYNWTDHSLMSRQHAAREWMRSYNQTSRLELSLRREILTLLLGKAGEGLWIDPPFFCESKACEGSKTGAYSRK